MWSGGRLSKVQTTTRLDHVWPEVWTNLSKVAQRRETQEWANEEPKLENARKLRGIYLIDPEDKEYPETFNNSRKKLDIQMEAAMPCKKKNPSHSSFQETEARLRVPDKISKTKHACIVESQKSTRQRMEPTFQRGHEDHIAAKGANFCESWQFGAQIHSQEEGNEKSVRGLCIATGHYSSFCGCAVDLVLDGADDDQDRGDEENGQKVETLGREEEVNGWRDNAQSDTWWHVDERSFLQTRRATPWAMRCVWTRMKCVQMCEKIRGVRVFCSHPRRLQWIAINCKRNQL